MNKAMLRKLLNFIFSAKLYSSSQGQHMQRNKLMLYASIFPFSCWVELPVFQKIGDLKWEKVFTDFEFKRGNTKLFMIPRQQVISDPTWSWSANHHGRRPEIIPLKNLQWSQGFTNRNLQNNFQIILVNLY